MYGIPIATQLCLRDENGQIFLSRLCTGSDLISSNQCIFEDSVPSLDREGECILSMCHVRRKMGGAMMFHRRHRISTRALLGECLWTWAILARNILVTILSFLTRRYRLLTTIPHCCWRLLSSTSNICTVRLFSSWIMALLEVPNDPIFTTKDDALGRKDGSNRHVWAVSICRLTGDICQCTLFTTSTKSWLYVAPSRCRESICDDDSGGRSRSCCQSNELDTDIIGWFKILLDWLCPHQSLLKM